MSLAQELSHATLDTIRRRCDMAEVGDPYMPLVVRGMPEPLGAARVFRGDRVVKMVYVGLAFPPAGLDSHMIYAFTAPESPIPHFTLDAVLAGDHFAFHLDLIPRVDLGANLAYIDAVHHPLTDEFEATKRIEGLAPAQITPRQSALMSPWMLAYRADERAFAHIERPVGIYLEHWFGLVERGLPSGLGANFDPAALAGRDQRNRAAIFNPAVDPVWAQVERLLGAEVGERLREILRSPVVEEQL
ncbi:MAG: hypothetical protein HGA45_05510 [Chloroflexales bacterium]|nr:hypothetical protein [Chloroflexales bacterium]